MACSPTPLFHVPRQELPRVLLELHATLKPSVFKHWYPIGANPAHDPVAVVLDLMQPVGPGWRVSSRRSKRPALGRARACRSLGGMTLAYYTDWPTSFRITAKVCFVGIV
jgi:hypothetical protein